MVHRCDVIVEVDVEFHAAPNFISSLTNHVIIQFQFSIQ